MSGPAIVGTLLRADAALMAVVPSAKIFNGVIPILTVLPAISIIEVSTVEARTLRMGSTAMLATSRVQVTVQAKSYAALKAIIELVRKSLPHTRGTVGVYYVDSILPDGAGPDFQEVDASIYMQSRDVIVKFNAA